MPTIVQQPNPAKPRFHLKTWQGITVLVTLAALVGGYFVYQNQTFTPQTSISITTNKKEYMQGEKETKQQAVMDISDIETLATTDWKVYESPWGFQVRYPSYYQFGAYDVSQSGPEQFGFNHIGYYTGVDLVITFPPPGNIPNDQTHFELAFEAVTDELCQVESISYKRSCTELLKYEPFTSEHGLEGYVFYVTLVEEVNPFNSESPWPTKSTLFGPVFVLDIKQYALKLSQFLIIAPPTAQPGPDGKFIETNTEPAIIKTVAQSVIFNQKQEPSLESIKNQYKGTPQKGLYGYLLYYPDSYLNNPLYSIWNTYDEGDISEEWGVNKGQETIFSITVYPRSKKDEVFAKNNYHITDEAVLFNGITAYRLKGLHPSDLIVERDNYFYVIYSSFADNVSLSKYEEYQAILESIVFSTL